MTEALYGLEKLAPPPKKPPAPPPPAARIVTREVTPVQGWGDLAVTRL